jgi:large subunit ribosomal protein L24
MKIKKGDTVLIISGKDRGRKGKVIEALPQKGKIVVEEINMIKKRVRPKKSGEKGQMVKLASAFDASNAKIVCPKCGEASRIAYKKEKDKKYRICKKCNQEL